MKMRSVRRAVRWLVAAGGLALCLLGTALAQRAGVTRQGYPFLTGGVGSDERAAMDAAAPNYTLRLEFARTDGAYLGDVRVDLRGPAAVDLTTDGPVLLLRLPPGTYAVTATSGGLARRGTVSVGTSGLRRQAFFW